MHRYLETDGVPAPSDCELEAADREWSRLKVACVPIDALSIAIKRAKLDFNEFCTIVGLTYQRGPFRAHIAAAGLAGTRQTEAEWWTWFGRMLKDEDASDQADTLADSLT